MDVGSAFGMFAGDLVDRSVRASLLFSSAMCFQRVTTAWLPITCLATCILGVSPNLNPTT